MKTTDISPAFERRLARLETYVDRPALAANHAQLLQVINELDGNFTTTDDLFEILHQAQRLTQLYEGGLENEAAHFAKLAKENVPSWKEYGAPPVAESLQRNLGDRLYNVGRVKNPFAMLFIDDQSRVAMNHIANRLIEDGIPFDANFPDRDHFALTINAADDAGVKRIAQELVERYEPVNTEIIARTETTRITPDLAKKSIYDQITGAIKGRRQNGEIYYTLTVLPTPRDADLEGMSYPEYVRLFFESIDQPKRQITEANNFLIGKVNGAAEIRIQNRDGTDVRCVLRDRNGLAMTFCNSVENKNVPGSEVFSAPRRDSVNGIVVSKGRFICSHDNSKIVENLTVVLKNGKITSFSADKGAAYFQEYLDRDPNNSYIGELGIGTNPHLRQHLMNSLLVEKIGRSFHFAYGGCYRYTAYEGTPVKVDNGNHTNNGDHWDVTTLIDRITVDGEVLMDNGRWLNPVLAVLNQGWAAVPVDERPDYWKSFLGYDDDDKSMWASSPGLVSAPKPQ